MRRIFVDTNYFVAHFNVDDEHHERALRVTVEIAAGETPRYVTLLASLSEFLSYTSRGTARIRNDAAAFVDAVRASQDFRIIGEDEASFDAGLTLYRQRLNKQYSLVDCMSMVSCRRMKITEVLTGDRDFEREGFNILL